MKITHLLFICALIVTSVLIAGCGEAKVAEDGDTVSVHYHGTLNDGTVFDSSRERGEPLEFILGVDNMIPGFENAVRGMKVGEINTVTLPPEEAYGEPQEELILTLSLDMLVGGIEPEIGQQLVLTLAEDQQHLATVLDISETEITVDANHPLAGKELTFEIELMAIETAE
jgi:peptidylprolyl isomerase